MQFDKKVLRKWLVLVGAFVNMMLVLGFVSSMGRLFVIVMDTFHSSRALTAAIQSVTLGVFYGSGILSGVFVDKVGPRTGCLLGSTLISIGLASSFLANSVFYLIISIGIFTAIGVALTFISCPAAVGMHFDGKNNLMALTTLSVGAGIGGIIYPYLIDTLHKQYGLRGMLLIFGGMISHGLAIALMFRPSNTRLKNNKRVANSNFQQTTSICIISNDNILNNGVQQLKHETVSKQTDTNIISDIDEENIDANKTYKSITILFTNNCFVTFCIGMIFAYPAVEVYTIFLVDIFIDKRLTIEDASFGLVIFNIFSVVGRFLPGSLNQLSCVSALAVPAIASCFGLFPSIILLFADSFIITILCTCFLGISIGTFYAVLSVTTAAIVGKDHLSNGIGIVCTLVCVPSLALGPISGWLRDKTDSYNIVFIAVSVLMSVGLLLFGLAQYFHSTSRNTRTR